MAEETEQVASIVSERGVITLGEKEFTLIMPKGRKGRQGILQAQRAFEALMDGLEGNTSLESLGADALRAARAALEHPGFEDDIMPWMLENTTEGWTKKKALEFLDELAVSPIEIMNAFIVAMSFFLAGSDQPALEEAMGK